MSKIVSRRCTDEAWDTILESAASPVITLFASVETRHFGGLAAARYAYECAIGEFDDRLLFLFVLVDEDPSPFWLSWPHADWPLTRPVLVAHKRGRKILARELDGVGMVAAVEQFCEDTVKLAEGLCG